MLQLYTKFGKKTTKTVKNRFFPLSWIGETEVMAGGGGLGTVGEIGSCFCEVCGGVWGTVMLSARVAAGGCTEDAAM